jgi:hypothetical protein
MKFRNLLMTAAFLLAVTSTFAIKARWTIGDYLSYKLGGTCYVGRGSNPADCDPSYTGAQCTYVGQPAYVYDVVGFPPPTCTIPLRQH